MSDKKSTPIDEDSPDYEVHGDVESMAEEIAAAADTSGGDEVAGLKSLLRESQDRALRIQAEAENVRKRARRDAEESLKFATMPLLRDLLPVIDNLQRAIEAQEPDVPAKGLLDGVRMVADQLSSVLNQHHCQAVAAEGQPFDPMVHEAVLQQPSDQPQGTVIQVTQQGYQLHDRVIRPTQVIVSQGEAT